MMYLLKKTKYDPSLLLLLPFLKPTPVDIGRKLTSLCTFNLHPVSVG